MSATDGARARPKAGAVVFALDVARVARFYERVAALRVVVVDAAKVVMESDAATLVVHGIPAPIAASIALTDPPQVRHDTAVKIILPVASLTDARAVAAALGGRVAPGDEAWSAGDFTACDGHDPEGNVVQFRESRR